MVKNLPSVWEDPSLIPGWGRSPGEGTGNPLQYSYLENPMDRGSWRATVHGVANSWTGLSDQQTHIYIHTHTHTHTHTPILVAAAMVASTVTALSESKYPTTRPDKHFLTISWQ